jgi:hypothetical protein
MFLSDFAGRGRRNFLVCKELQAFSDVTEVIGSPASHQTLLQKLNRFKETK